MSGMNHADMTYGELHLALGERWSDMLDEPVSVSGPFVLVDGAGSRRVLAATLVRADVTMTEPLPNDSRDVTPCVRGLEAQLLATRVWH